MIVTLSGRRRSAAEQIPISHRPRLVSVRGGGASGLGWKYEVQLLNSCSCQSFLFYNIVYIIFINVFFTSSQSGYKKYNGDENLKYEESFKTI